MNNFINEGMKNSAIVSSENGAMKYNSTSNEFLTQFGQIASYRKARSFSEVSNDMSTLWAIDPQLAMRFAFFVRMISRANNVTGNKDRGAGMRAEGILRVMWMQIHHPNEYWKNFHLYISIGSVKDIIDMMVMDKNNQLNWNKLGGYVISYLTDENQSELMKKYLPQYYSTGKQKTERQIRNSIVAKHLMTMIGISQKEYRLLKSSGTAHSWQQAISTKSFNKLNFDKIHGRALMKLSKGKFFANQGLVEQFLAYIEKNDTLKYTGHIVDLFTSMNQSNILRNKTIDRQFMSTVETIKSNLIVVRDTSASMASPANGLKTSCFDVAKAIALWFSYSLKGEFENNWIEFNNTAKMHTWKGTTPTEKWFNDKSSFVGSTNFMSVIELFANLLKNGVPESDFPEGILCISDNEFNAAQIETTNVESARKLLREAGFSNTYVDNFKIVLWNLKRVGHEIKFETYDDHTNVFYFSGYSPEIIHFLNGDEVKAEGEKVGANAVEVMLAALNQPTLQLIV